MGTRTEQLSETYSFTAEGTMACTRQRPKLGGHERMSSRPKSIQVDYDLFMRMVSYILFHIDPNDESIKEIIEGIRQKLLAMERRDYFTLHKMGDKAPDIEDTMSEYQALLSQLEVLHW